MTSSAFVTEQEIYELGVPFEMLSLWMTNDLIHVAYKNKYERFFWTNEILALKEKYIDK